MSEFQGHEFGKKNSSFARTELRAYEEEIYFKTFIV